VGDYIRLRILDPVLVHERVVLPQGTVVSAVLDGLDPVATMRDRIRLRLHVTHLTFAGGYSVAFARPVRTDSSDDAETVVALRNGDRDVEAGTSIELDLRRPLELERAPTVSAAARWSETPPLVRDRQVDSCFVPGSAGTPDIVIPGTPGSPSIPGIPATADSPGTADVPGTPGTPATIIPGTPSTPGMWVPCG
jgi:hypothetical protein